MQKLESLNSKKFQKLSEQQISLIIGGDILPKKGTECGDVVKLPSGETATYCVDWRTGFFSNTKTYGDAYIGSKD